MLRVNTRVETQGDRTGGEERLNKQAPRHILCLLNQLLLLSPGWKTSSSQSFRTGGFGSAKTLTFKGPSPEPPT
jgi:hypothetical protein